MRGERLSIGLKATVLAIFTVTLFVTSAYAASEKLLHSFNNNGKDGTYPYANLIFDASGNLYGTTEAGGAHGYGAVFEFSPKTGGGWTEKLLHSFGATSTDAQRPAAGLILDASGNLYGTTNAGGVYGYGAVFELSPKTGGGWTEKLLHSFNENGVDGAKPNAVLIFDGAGNLYGTTLLGGAVGGPDYPYGTVFELSPTAGGHWTETVLYSFGPTSTDVTDGYNPFSSLIFDGVGNLYGTTGYGGAYQDGTVFELSPAAGGGWTEAVLYSFGATSTDGYNPFSSLIFDGVGNLYGTTNNGGAYHFHNGTVFELSPEAGGLWTETVLHSFNKNGTNNQYGYAPYAGLIFDASGNLYGTTTDGGTSGNGTVFEFSPAAGGIWTETVLHSFLSRGGKDGSAPYTGLIFDAEGNLYGTTQIGGHDGYGTVFEITP
jgi:uncharacterized repeat protein (TIGR03803 family)